LFKVYLYYLYIIYIYIGKIIEFFYIFKIKMNISIKIKNLDNKNEKYDVSLKTYKESITEIFNKEDLRYLIEKIDNAII